MKYSVIVPCYNCDETIAPLLDSIKNQEDLDLKDLEVILVDDTESHSFVDKVEPYTNEMNITVIGTELKYHNPGNSRNYGLYTAKGKWILFIDCDDVFLPGAFKAFNKSIDEYPALVHFAKIVCHAQENALKDSTIERNLIWTHGKVYNREFIERHHIRFPKNLKTSEDLYFSYQILVALANENQDYKIIDEYVYDWQYNPNSLSRSQEEFKNLDLRVYDYIKCYTEPFIKGGNQNPVGVFTLFIKYLIVVYFLYQLYIYKCKPLKKDLAIKALSKACEIFEMTILDIINYVEAHPEEVIEQYQSFLGLYPKGIVPPHSFRDWVLSIMN